jgi:hypothetical protein
MTRKTVNYGLEMKLFGVPAVAIVEDVSMPSKLQDNDGEDFWTSHIINASFENKKLYEYDMGTTQKQWEKRRKLIEKNDESNSIVKTMQVKDEYQLPFSETGYRSSIFDVGYEEKITKANLKKWLVEKAYAELGIKENTYAETSTRRVLIGVTDVKEFKLKNTK